MQDRGTKKWTSLMLPEHLEMIKALWAEENKKTKPILSDQQLEENEYILREALEANLVIQVKYFKDHDFHIINGEVRVASDYLMINNTQIKLSDVLEVRRLNG